MGLLFKFKFDCKGCGKTSRTNLKVKSKFLLEQELGDKLELVCSKCHEMQTVRIKQLNAVIDTFWMILLVTVFIFADYLLVGFLSGNYWRPEITQFGDSISVIFFGLMLPIVLLIFILKRIGNYKDQLNRHDSHISLVSKDRK